MSRDSSGTIWIQNRHGDMGAALRQKKLVHVVITSSVEIRGLVSPRYRFSITTIVFGEPPTWSVCYTICPQASDIIEYSKAASAREWPTPFQVIQNINLTPIYGDWISRLDILHTHIERVRRTCLDISHQQCCKITICLQEQSVQAWRHLLELV